MTPEQVLTDCNFARGFDRGEREAFRDRRARTHREPPDTYEGEELRGWIAGYTPRTEILLCELKYLSK